MNQPVERQRREPKVRQSHSRVSRNENILELDVAVDNLEVLVEEPQR